MVQFITLLLIIFIQACSTVSNNKQSATDNTGPLAPFVILEDKIIYSDVAPPILFKLNEHKIISNDLLTGHVWLSKSQTSNGKNNEGIEAQILPGIFSINTSDRILISIRTKFQQINKDQIRYAHYFPIITSLTHKNMPMQKIAERINKEDKLIEQKFIAKIPKAGQYKMFILKLDLASSNDTLEIYIGENQIERTIEKNNSCITQLAYNLRHCIPYECSVDMTSSYQALETPPLPIINHYTISKNQNICKINISSTSENTKQCQIPIDFNFLIQDSTFPLRDPNFVQALNILNNKVYKAESVEEMESITSELKSLWLDYYPLSLMSDKELDFQLPDIDLLLNKYCKDVAATGNPQLITWKELLQKKMAIKQATLNFKTSSLINEQNNHSHNDQIQISDENNKLEAACLKENKTDLCLQLSENLVKQNDFSNAAVVSAHACKLKNSLACQKAGLALTQAKDRKSARIYEIQGCDLKDSISCYNVACGYCIDGNEVMALKYFKQHLKLGLEDPMHIVFDPTIQCLKNTPTFKKILEKALAP